MPQTAAGQQAQHAVLAGVPFLCTARCPDTNMSRLHQRRAEEKKDTMHRKNPKRLHLHHETLRSLTELHVVRGAVAALTGLQLSCIQICPPVTINITCTCTLAVSCAGDCNTLHC